MSADWFADDWGTRRVRAPIERFWAKVNKADSCWLWMATKNRQGYGRFTAAGRKTSYAGSITLRTTP